LSDSHPQPRRSRAAAHDRYPLTQGVLKESFETFGTRSLRRCDEVTL
jgi:hypothetical protein